MGRLKIKKSRDSFSQMIRGAESIDSAPLYRQRINGGEWLTSAERRVCIRWRDGREVWYPGGDLRVLALFYKETKLEVGHDHKYPLEKK